MASFIYSFSTNQTLNSAQTKTSNGSDVLLLRTFKCDVGNREPGQSASVPEPFTRSASAETYMPIIFFEDESLTFKRAASADVSAVPTSARLRSDRNDTDLVMVAALQQRASSTKTSPYTKVLCKFNDGANEVSLSL